MHGNKIAHRDIKPENIMKIRHKKELKKTRAQGVQNHHGTSDNSNYALADYGVGKNLDYEERYKQNDIYYQKG